MLTDNHSHLIDESIEMETDLSRAQSSVGSQNQANLELRSPNC